MAALTVLSIPQIGPIYKGQGTRIVSKLAGVGGLVAGQAVFYGPLGTALPCNTAVAGSEQFRGIALETVGAGQGCDILEQGFAGGFDLSALAYDALVYAQDTGGVLGTTAGTKTVQVGRVVALSDRDPATGAPSKALYVFADPIRNW